MRYFFSRAVPAVRRILVVESGARSVTEALLPKLRSAFGPDAAVDLVTCYAGLPAGWPSDTRVYRVSDYAGPAGRGRLYRELRANDYSLTGIYCSGERIMTKWKWALAMRVPAKVFIVNENADFFWFDRSQRRLILHVALLRSGLSGGGAMRTAANLAAFPFTVLMLAAYALVVHTRRALRGKVLHLEN